MSVISPAELDADRNIEPWIKLRSWQTPWSLLEVGERSFFDKRPIRISGSALLLCDQLLTQSPATDFVDFYQVKGETVGFSGGHAGQELVRRVASRGLSKPSAMQFLQCLHSNFEAFLAFESVVIPLADVDLVLVVSKEGDRLEVKLPRQQREAPVRWSSREPWLFVADPKD